MKSKNIFLAVVFLASSLSAQLKISQLADGVTAQNGDLIPIARSSSNYSLSIAEIIAAAAAGIPNGGISNAMLAHPSITVNAGSGLSGGGTVALGGTITLTNTLSGGTVTNVATGSGLSGGPITTTGTISIPAAGVTNSMLANPSITVTAGSGLSGGGTVALGGTVTLTNTASGGTVTNVATGAGLTGGPCTTTCTVSIATGSVTNAMLANSSVTVTAGSGLSGGGSVALGGTITLTNTASGGTVTNVATGSGLSGGPCTTTCTISIPAAGVSNAMLANNSVTVTAGSGLSGGGSVALGGTITLNSTGSSTIASGSKALGTSAIASGACASVVTASAPGVTPGSPYYDVVYASFNGDPTGVTGYIPSTSGTLTIFVYPTANNVNFKVCNETASSITPGALTLNWRVAR